MAKNTPAPKAKLTKQRLHNLQKTRAWLSYSFMCSYFCVRCLKAAAVHPHSFGTNGHKRVGAVPPCITSWVPGRILKDIPGVSKRACAETNSKEQVSKKTLILSPCLKCDFVSDCHISSSVSAQFLQPSKYSNANANKKPWGL